MESRLSGSLFIRIVVKWQYNTKVKLWAEEDIWKKKKRFSDHIVITKNAIIQDIFQIFLLKKHEVNKNWLGFTKTKYKFQK